jgi:elongation factor Ts
MSEVQIDPKAVKALRDKTNAGMMECKAALVEAKGNLEAAVDILRKKGAANAAKKADRETREGVVAFALSSDQTAASLVEVNCETDFVARNEDFRGFCDRLAKTVLENPSADLEPLRQETITKTGENVTIRRHERLQVSGAGQVAAYIHQGSKLGVLVEVGASKADTLNNPAFKELVRSLTLQIAAMNPLYVRSSDVPADVLERERQVQSESKDVQGKPANIVENIVKGKLNAFYKQICLLDQENFQNNKQSIAQLLAETSKALSDEISVRKFLRFMVGDSSAS